MRSWHITHVWRFAILSAVTQKKLCNSCRHFFMPVYGNATVDKTLLVLDLCLYIFTSSDYFWLNLDGLTTFLRDPRWPLFGIYDVIIYHMTSSSSSSHCANLKSNTFRRTIYLPSFIIIVKMLLKLRSWGGEAPLAKPEWFISGGGSIYKQYGYVPLWRVRVWFSSSFQGLGYWNQRLLVQNRVSLIGKKL